MDSTAAATLKLQQQQQSRKEKLELWQRQQGRLKAAAPVSTSTPSVASNAIYKENFTPTDTSKSSKSISRPALQSVNQNTLQAPNTAPPSTAKVITSETETKLKQSFKTIKYLQESAAKKQVLITSLQEQVKDAETKCTEMAAKLTTESLHHESINAVLRQDYDNLKLKLSHSDMKRVQLTQQLDELTESMQNMANDYVSRHRFDALQLELQTFKSEMLEYEDQIISDAERLETSEKTISDLMQEKHDIESRSLAAEAKNMTLTGHIDNVTAELDVLRVALRDTLDENKILGELKSLQFSTPANSNDVQDQECQTVSFHNGDDIMALRASNDIMFQQMEHNHGVYKSSIEETQTKCRHWEQAAKKVIVEKEELKTKLQNVEQKLESTQKSYISEQRRNEQNQKHVTELERLIAEVMNA